MGRSSGNRAEPPFPDPGWEPFPSVCLRISTWKDMIPPSSLHSFQVIHTPRTGKLLIYPFSTALYRNTFVRAQQSYGPCEEQRECLMGERYRSPPNEEIRSGFGSWLLFFKNLPHVCIPGIGQCHLTPSHPPTIQTGRDGRSFHLVPNSPQESSFYFLA